ncbi:hypothetical protein [Macrococcus capreoli]|nr:hypothetical protein [Macrococcus sp. TMW 2.2395]
MLYDIVLEVFKDTSEPILTPFFIIPNSAEVDTEAEADFVLET